MRAVQSRRDGLQAGAEASEVQYRSLLAPMVSLLQASEPDPWSLERLCLLPLLPDELAALEQQAWGPRS